MSVVINTNSSAITVANNLAILNATRQKSLNRLSCGVKIVSPADSVEGVTGSMKVFPVARRQGTKAATISNAALENADADSPVDALAGQPERPEWRAIHPNDRLAA